MADCVTAHSREEGGVTERDKRRKEAQGIVDLSVNLIEQVLTKQMVTILEEMRALQKCCSQRTARLQILREAFTDNDWKEYCEYHPPAADWFDSNGVPK